MAALDYFSHIIFLYCLSIAQILGILHNLLQILILLQKEPRANVIYRLMTWICVCDILSQSSTFLVFSPFLIREYSPFCFGSRTYQDILFYFFGTVSFDTFQRVSTWLAVVIGLFEVMQVSNKSRTLKVVLILVPLSIVWSYMVYFINAFNPIYSEKDCFGNEVKFSEPRYQLSIVPKHKSLYDRIQIIDRFVKLIPVLFEMVLWWIMFRAEQKSTCDERIRREKIARLIIIFSFPYILVGLPTAIIDVLKVLDPENSLTLNLSLYSSILPVLNSVSHFFICLIFSPKCQNAALLLIGKRSKQNETHVVQVAMASKRNSVIPQDDVSGFAFTIN